MHKFFLVDRLISDLLDDFADNPENSQTRERFFDVSDRFGQVLDRFCANIGAVRLFRASPMTDRISKSVNSGQVPKTEKNALLCMVLFSLDSSPILSCLEKPSFRGLKAPNIRVRSSVTVWQYQ